MKKYTEYIENFQCINIENVNKWININLKNHLNKNNENQTEIEHILDYLCSTDCPNRTERMSYKEALSNSEKWMKKQIKKGSKIQESKNDTEIIIECNNGFKWVKLISQSSYAREGHLMRHCISSYYGKNTNIYSLRDINNNPHCTIEENKQIKGKGNGSINPKYIEYVVKFLEHLGMNVSDNEMKNLGYINIEKHLKYLHDNCIKKAYNNKYLPIDFNFKDKKNNEYWDWDFASDNPEEWDLNKINDSVNDSVKKCKLKKLDSHQSQSGDNSQQSQSGDNSQQSQSGNYSKQSQSGYDNHQSQSGYDSKQSQSGYYSQQSQSGYDSQQRQSGNYSQQSQSGNYSKQSQSGNYSQQSSVSFSGKSESNGDYNLNAGLGIKERIKTNGKNSWFILIDWTTKNNKYIINDIHSGIVGESQIKETLIQPDIWYWFEDGILKSSK